ncbi:MAG: hypothetical protein J2P17_08455, partial [Mycobacterium sp.]|nr:hypothetical protein [Mycobacterium sp.]
DEDPNGKNDYTNDDNLNGKIGVRFFIDAEPHWEPVDRRLPHDAAGEPMYAAHTDGQALWASLMLKAYMQLPPDLVTGKTISLRPYGEPLQPPPLARTPDADIPAPNDRLAIIDNNGDLVTFHPGDTVHAVTDHNNPNLLHIRTGDNPTPPQHPVHRDLLPEWNIKEPNSNGEYHWHIPTQPTDTARLTGLRWMSASQHTPVYAPGDAPITVSVVSILGTDKFFLAGNTAITPSALQHLGLTLEDTTDLPLFPGTHPQPEDPAQGEAGNCWLIGPLKSIARVDPRAIGGPHTHEAILTEYTHPTNKHLDNTVGVRTITHNGAPRWARYENKFWNYEGQPLYAAYSAKRGTWTAFTEKGIATRKDHSYPALRSGFSHLALAKLLPPYEINDTGSRYQPVRTISLATFLHPMRIPVDTLAAIIIELAGNKTNPSKAHAFAQRLGQIEKIWNLKKHDLMQVFEVFLRMHLAYDEKIQWEAERTALLEYLKQVNDHKTTLTSTTVQRHVADLIRFARSRGDKITLDTRPFGYGQENITEYPGLVGTHTYSVVDVHVADGGAVTLTLENPWSENPVVEHPIDGLTFGTGGILTLDAKHLTKFDRLQMHGTGARFAIGDPTTKGDSLITGNVDPTIKFETAPAEYTTEAAPPTDGSTNQPITIANVNLDNITVDQPELDQAAGSSDIPQGINFDDRLHVPEWLHPPNALSDTDRNEDNDLSRSDTNTTNSYLDGDQFTPGADLRGTPAPGHAPTEPGSPWPTPENYDFDLNTVRGTPGTDTSYPYAGVRPVDLLDLDDVLNPLAHIPNVNNFYEPSWFMPDAVDTSGNEPPTNPTPPNTTTHDTNRSTNTQGIDYAMDLDNFPVHQHRDSKPPSPDDQAELQPTDDEQIPRHSRALEATPDQVIDPQRRFQYSDQTDPVTTNTPRLQTNTNITATHSTDRNANIQPMAVGQPEYDQAPEPAGTAAQTGGSASPSNANARPHAIPARPRVPRDSPRQLPRSFFSSDEKLVLLYRKSYPSVTIDTLACIISEDHRPMDREMVSTNENSIHRFAWNAGIHEDIWKDWGKLADWAYGIGALPDEARTYSLGTLDRNQAEDLYSVLRTKNSLFTDTQLQILVYRERGMSSIEIATTIGCTLGAIYQYENKMREIAKEGRYNWSVMAGWARTEKHLLPADEAGIDILPSADRARSKLLTDLQQLMLILHTCYGWNFQRIAESTGRAVGTVRSSVNRVQDVANERPPGVGDDLSKLLSWARNQGLLTEENENRAAELARA